MNKGGPPSRGILSSCTPQPAPGIRKSGHAGPASIPRPSKHPETASSRVKNDSAASRYPPTLGPPHPRAPPPGDTREPPGALPRARGSKKSQPTHIQRERASGSLWAPVEPKPYLPPKGGTSFSLYRPSLAPVAIPYPLKHPSLAPHTACSTQGAFLALGRSLPHPASLS